MKQSRPIELILIAAVLAASVVPVQADDQAKAPAIAVRPLGTSPEQLKIWSDPAFLEQFDESYIAAKDIEPTVKADELKQVREAFGLLTPDEKELALRTPDKDEARLIKEGKFDEVRQMRATKDAKADQMRVTNTDKAVEILTKLRTPTCSAVIPYTLGNVAFQRNQLDEAASAYNEAISKFKTYRRAHQNLAMIYLKQEKFKDAIAPMTKVIELGGADSMTYGLLGYCYSMTDDSLAAESAYRLAILLDPKKPDWKMGLIQALFKQERFADVAAMCRTLLANDPSSARLWLIQANAYIGLQQPDKAAENYEIVDRLGHSTAASLNNLGDIYINQEVYDLAVRSYIKALEADQKTSADRAIRAAKVLAGRSQYAELKPLLSRIDDLRGKALTDTQRKDVLKLRARMAVAEGAGKDEADILHQIVQLDPLDGDALILLGQHSQRQGDKEKAVFYYERAEALADFEADALIRHAQLLVSDNKYDQALPLLRRSLMLKPRENVQQYHDQVERASKTR